jgi:Membrane protein involved in the export of O-antigen and teichoic acid
VELTIKNVIEGIRSRVVGKRVDQRGNGSLPRTMRSFAFLSGEKVLRSFLSIFVGAWVLRYLGPTLSGTISFILANVAILTIAIKLGLDSIILRDVNLHPEHRGSLLGSALTLQFATGIVVFALWISLVLLTPHTPIEILMTVILSSTLLVQPLSVFELWFQGSGQVEKPVMARVSVMIVLSSLRVAAIISGFGVLVFSALQASEVWLTNTINYIIFRRAPKFRLEPSADRCKTLLRESWTYLISGLAIIVYMRIDQIMLGTLLDKHAVGIFYAGASLCEALYFIPIALNTSIIPSLISLRTTDLDKYERVLVRYCNATLVYTIVIGAVVWALAPTIVALLYGHAFSESAGVLRTYIVAFVFVGTGTAQSLWFINNHRGDVLMKKSVAGAVTNIALNFYLIPHYGPIGAACSTVASQFVATFGSNFIFDRRFVKLQIASAVGQVPRNG